MTEDGILNNSNSYSTEQSQLMANPNILENTNKTEDIKEATKESEVILTSPFDKLTLPNHSSQTKQNEESSNSDTKMLEDDDKQVQENNNSKISSLVDNQDEAKKEIQKKEKIAIQVLYGNRLIETLDLHYFNNNIYFYQYGVYKIVTSMDLTSAILKYINPSTEPAVCKKVLFYVKNILYNDEIVHINTNYVNFKNCLYDLNNQVAIAHTPNIFTVNQLSIDYNPTLPYNSKVEKYLDEISNYNVLRRKGLLQIIGYILTSKNNIQKIIVIYGPSASNGKSALLKIIERIIGSDNVCHKSIEEFDKDFGADGMEFKLLNISTELPQTKIKDISVLKKTVTGDTFETRVKFEKNKTIVDTYIKHLYATNFLPDVADDSEGYYRRLHIILLDNVFDPETSTFNVDEFCTQENLNYLGNIAFKEYLSMVNSGCLEFANSEESKKILENYRIENNSVLAFLTDEEVSKTIYDTYIPRETMLKLYKSFCSLNDYSALGKNTFYRELKQKYNFAVQVKENGTKYCFYRENPVSKIKDNK